MSVQAIGTNSVVNSLGQVRAMEEDSDAFVPTFSQFLENQIQSVDKLLATSDKQATEVAIGKSENLHDAMIAYEKAESALKLLVQVRNRALDAYHEVLRMQV